MTSLAIKYFLVISFNLFFAKSTHSDNNDTSKFYYKILDDGSIGEINLPQYADYYRLIITPDSADKNFIVKEFYKNKQPKLIGQYKRSFGVSKDGRGTLEGPCQTFFENGQKQSTATYANGLKIGIENSYFPNGRVYAVKKNIDSADPYARNRERCLECYDINGAATCVGGTGLWTVYDDDFKSVVLQGTVKNGLRDGEWKGSTVVVDSIKFIYKYKKGVFVEGTGFDKSGKANPFTKEVEQANCRLGMIDYLNLIHSRIKLPKDEHGNKMPLEDFTLSFIIEKDGQLSHIEAVGAADSAFSESLKAAVLKSGGWNPRKYFGIPMRTQIIVPLKYNGSFSGWSYVRDVWYKEKVLGF